MEEPTRQGGKKHPEPTSHRPRHAMGCRPSDLIHIQRIRGIRPMAAVSLYRYTKRGHSRLAAEYVQTEPLSRKDAQRNRRSCAFSQQRRCCFSKTGRHQAGPHPANRSEGRLRLTRQEP
jgi:hypothetical protein